MGLHNEALHLRLEEHDGEAIMDVDIAVRRPAPVRQGVELAVGVLYRIMRSLLGPGWRPLVCFAHDAPQRRDTHRRLFGERLAFGQEFNGIVCATRDLDRATPASDPAFARYARQHLDALLAKPRSSTADKVRELVQLQLGSGQCSVEHVAAQLGIDRRTLHRQLGREGLTYSGIVDTVRDDLVAKALQSEERTLSAVADMLGFSSLSAFSRWFRTRFHATPSDWRTRLAP
jgi:AraC-like DNA-binding protein